MLPGEGVGMAPQTISPGTTPTLGVGKRSPEALEQGYAFQNRGGSLLPRSQQPQVRGRGDGWQHPVVGTTDFVKQRVRGLRCTGNSFEGLEERWAVYQVLPNSSLICIHQRLGMLNTTLPNLLTMMDGPGTHFWPTNKSVYDKGFWEGLSLKHRGQYSSLP